MFKPLPAACLLGVVLTALAAPAEARIYGNVYIGGGGYYPGGYGYPGYYAPYPYYVAPPPVVYLPPVYAAPAYPAPAYAAPAQAAPAPGDQSSPTFTDDQGRTCRDYQKPGTAGQQITYDTVCQQPDGTWRLAQ